MIAKHSPKHICFIEIIKNTSHIIGLNTSIYVKIGADFNGSNPAIEFDSFLVYVNSFHKWSSNDYQNQIWRTFKRLPIIKSKTNFESVPFGAPQNYCDKFVLIYVVLCKKIKENYDLRHPCKAWMDAKHSPNHESRQNS